MPIMVIKYSIFFFFFGFTFSQLLIIIVLVDLICAFCNFQRERDRRSTDIS
jgi:uncharacterized membrane protein